MNQINLRSLKILNHEILNYKLRLLENIYIIKLKPSFKFSSFFIGAKEETHVTRKVQDLRKNFFIRTKTELHIKKFKSLHTLTKEPCMKQCCIVKKEKPSISHSQY